MAVELPARHLAVVPLLGDTGCSRLDLEAVNVASTAPRGKVLAVTTPALVPSPASQFAADGKKDLS